MRQTMGLDRVEALEVEHRLEEAVGGGVAIDRRDDVGAESVADRGLVFERVGIGLADQLGRDIGIIEPLGDAVDDRRLQRVVMQDGRIDEGRELGLAPRDLLGLAADARPDRVDLIEPLRALTCCWAMIVSAHSITRASLAHSARRWTIPENAPLHGKVCCQPAESKQETRR